MKYILTRLVLPVLRMLCAIAVAAPCYGADFFVDSIDGSDRQAGTSPDSAWASLEKINGRVFDPGDRILFRAGSRYTGVLKPQGSGTPAEPIVIDRYREGPLPRIDGEGVVPATVLLHNVEGWEVRNLEITNTGGKRMGNRRGVHILNEELETARHIVLDGLYVHDVNGLIPKSRAAGMAILAEANDKGRYRFDGLTINNCRIENCERDAIRVWGVCNRDRWFPSLNVVISSNLIERVGGDGIVPAGCDGALVEHNVMRDCTRLGQKAGAAAGIWPWSCDNTLIQFNEVSDHKAWVDAQGFDSDYNCSNTVIQYNYSHDNEGGFLLICCPGHTSHNRGTVIRYNVSLNDGLRMDKNNKGFFSPTFHISGPAEDNMICSNIIIIPEKPDPAMDRSIVAMDNWKGPWPVDTVFSNNVFWVEGSADFEFGKDRGTVFINNRYIGRITGMPEDSGTLAAVSAHAGPLLPGDSKGYEVLRSFMLTKEVPTEYRGMLDLAPESNKR